MDALLTNPRSLVHEKLAEFIGDGKPNR